MGALLSVALGSALGGASRYLLTILFVSKSLQPATATMLINIAGSFFAGVLVAVLPSVRENAFWSREFLIAGILGGFTTFSAFSLQTIELFREERLGAAFVNIVGSVAFSLVAAWVGYKLSLMFTNR